MNKLVTILRSTVAMKFLVALTGACLFAFVLVHMLGNLGFFAGRSAYNDYAHFLKSMGPALSGARIGLVVVFVVHVILAIRLKLLNVEARPAGYAVDANLRAGYASRTMFITGIIVFVFVIFHLLHFTFGVVYPEYFAGAGGEGEHDVYGMVVKSFQHTWIAAVYLSAMVVLIFHLSHAIAGFFRSIGLQSPGFNAFMEKAAVVIAFLVGLGFAGVPLLVLLTRSF